MNGISDKGPLKYVKYLFQVNLQVYVGIPTFYFPEVINVFLDYYFIIKGSSIGLKPGLARTYDNGEVGFDHVDNNLCYYFVHCVAEICCSKVLKNGGIREFWDQAE